MKRSISYYFKAFTILFIILLTSGCAISHSDITHAREFDITISNTILHGSVTADKKTAKAGETITLTITPYTDYTYGKLRIIPGGYSENALAFQGEGKTRTFTMPENYVYVEAEFDLYYTPLTIGENGVPETTAKRVTFGEYPQSKLTDSSVTVNENNSKTAGDFTYYKGSDNAWYAKKNSNYYKVEPIKWRILTENYDHDCNASTPGKRLMLAEDILSLCAFYDGNSERVINSVIIREINYEHSRVRAFLNGLSYKKYNEDENVFLGKGFINTAFTEEERQAIANTSVVNNLNSALPADYDSLPDTVKENYWFNGDNNNIINVSTDDKIFLLSVNETTRNEYDFGNFALKYNNLNYEDKNKSKRPVAFATEDTSCTYQRWWTRTPYPIGYDEVFFIWDDGTYSIVAGGSGAFNTATYGVVPALCLN